MPTISKRGELMPQSPIRKLVPYAEDAIKKGKTIFYLNIGQPDIKTPDVALKAVRDNTIDILSYSRSEGSETYRKKLAEYYKKHHINVTHHDIVVTTGASEGLIFLFNSIMNPGDEVIVAEPFYANYMGFSTATGIHIVPAICDVNNDFALPTIETFEKLITPKTKALLICNPGNPTGSLFSESDIKKLAALAIKYDLFLISDEVYREFVYDGHSHYSVMQVPGLEQHAVVVDSVSKRYSMCGARVGCLVSKNKAVNHTLLKFAQSRLSPPTYALIASEAALDTPQRYFNEITEEYVQRRNTLILELEKIEGIKVTKPQGAFYCMVTLPVKNTNNFAQWLLEHFAVNNETIMVTPASGFYSTPNMGLNQIRIAYVLKKEYLIKAVNILKEALKIYKD